MTSRKDLCPDPLTLAELEIGQTAVVTDVTGEDTLAVRLLEMGLTPGITTTLLGRAPLGDPLEIEVRSYRLSLRRSEAHRVSVELRQ